FFTGNTTGSLPAVNSSTPYVQIDGSGDGSFDLYSFTITDAMLDPQGAQTSASAVSVPGPFYKSVGLTLNGTVGTNDTWHLGIGGYDLQVTGSSLLEIAQKLVTAIDALPGYS